MRPSELDKIGKKVGVILLNWNGLQDTLKCLDSLGKSEYLNWVPIVVDNDSAEDPREITELFPEVVLVENSENLGFAGGNNVGFAKAMELGCEYCWVLNNDTEVEPDCLTKLVDAMESNPECGAITNLIIYFYQPELSWFAGGDLKRGLPCIRGYFSPIETEGKSLGEIEDTDYLCGCSFIAKTSLLGQIKGFDEAYFCYVEDVDISMRIKEVGYSIGYLHSAVVRHKVSRASGNHSPIKLYYKHRNLLYFLDKYDMPNSTRIKWLLGSMRFILSLVIKHSKPKPAWYLARGLWDGERGNMGKCSAF